MSSTVESTSDTTPKSTTTKIILSPSLSTTIPQRTYTSEEQTKIDELRKYAETQRLPSSDPYYPSETRWLADSGCAERYMRAAKWKLEDGKKRLLYTLQWRREYKPDIIPPEDVRIESETGKIVISGFDKDGRPILTMNPGRENTNPSDRQIRHLIFCLERAIDLMPTPPNPLNPHPPNPTSEDRPHGQDSLVIVVNYKETTLRTNPSIGTAGTVLHILQSHYPERLGRAIVVNLPFLLEFFYRGIKPFLDPTTREKMKFNPDMKELVPDEQLDVVFGGSYNYEFEPTSYWNDLISYCRIAPDGTRQEASLAAEKGKGKQDPSAERTPSLDRSETSENQGSGPITPEHTTPSSPNMIPVVPVSSVLQSEGQNNSKKEPQLR